MVEKFRYFERQYLENIITSDLNWHTLAFGSLACRASANFDETWATNPGWLHILPWRESLYLKNQGVDNDNSTDCQIEIYFNAYDVNKFQSVGYGTTALAAANVKGLGYDATTGLFTLNTGGFITPTTGATPNDMYIEMPPFGVAHGNISDHNHLLSAVCTNVTLVGGNVYTFDIQNYELLTGAAAINLWPAVGTWTYNALTGWTHATGNATALVASWTPTAGRTYEISVTNVTTTPGTGLTITCGGQILKPTAQMASGTNIYKFTATSAAALTFTPGAGGTWVGRLTDVSVVIYDEGITDMLINNLTLANQNNTSFHPPTFYQYLATPPTTQRGIILNTGESYSGDLTYDVCIWYRGIATADIGATLVIQQLA